MAAMEDCRLGGQGRGRGKGGGGRGEGRGGRGEEIQGGREEGEVYTHMQYHVEVCCKKVMIARIKFCGLFINYSMVS